MKDSKIKIVVKIKNEPIEIDQLKHIFQCCQSMGMRSVKINGNDNYVTLDLGE